MPRRQQISAVVLPLGQKEARRRELRYRDAFLRMCAGLAKRPEPRGVFDRVSCGRVKPWEHVMVPVRLAIAAGQTKEYALEIVREMEREIESYYADAAADPAAILAGEAIREAQTREPKVRALVSRAPVDLIAAADAMEHEARADLEDARRLRVAAGLYRPHGAGGAARRAARAARRTTAIGAVEVVR